MSSFFFFNDTATTEIYTLSLHDALPISRRLGAHRAPRAPERGRATVPRVGAARGRPGVRGEPGADRAGSSNSRSEEHTSELQSRLHLVCRLLLEKKKQTNTRNISHDSTT